MGDTKVSVCMITYNHAAYIAQAVESVLAQRTDFPVEIVIGEDCSTDGTRGVLVDLARRNPQSIRLRLAEQNQGINSNFLGTLAACRGKYVALLEGDDFWTSPDKLQKQVEALDVHPEWAMCFHPAACMYEGDMEGPPVIPLEWNKPEATIEDLFDVNFIPTCSVVFRNRLVAAYPSWFHDLNLGDWPLHMIHAAQGNIGFLPEVMSSYRIHSNGVWSGATQAQRITGIFQMFTAIDHHFGGRYAAAIDAYRLNTVRYLLGEIEGAKHRLSIVATELDLEKTREFVAQTNADADAQTLQEYWTRISSDYNALESKYNGLVVKFHQLQFAYDTWKKSTPYRVVRETKRVFRTVDQFWRRLSPRQPKTQLPIEPPTSKAA
jgi:glycosyltransferase involved in cell wall biosynthesis